jgi:hypothetical protein
MNCNPAPEAKRDGAPLGENTMIRKIVLGLVAAASISAAALTPTAASAHGWGFGGGWGHHYGFGFRHFGFYRGYGYSSCYVVNSYGEVVNVCAY